VGSVGQASSNALRDDQGNGFTIGGGGFVGAFGMEKAELTPALARGGRIRICHASSKRNRARVASSA
jgi:hypothetical protein